MQPGSSVPFRCCTASSASLRCHGEGKQRLEKDSSGLGTYKSIQRIKVQKNKEEEKQNKKKDLVEANKADTTSSSLVGLNVLVSRRTGKHSHSNDIAKFVEESTKIFWCGAAWEALEHEGKKKNMCVCKCVRSSVGLRSVCMLED